MDLLPVLQIKSTDFFKGFEPINYEPHTFDKYFQIVLTSGDEE